MTSADFLGAGQTNRNKKRTFKNEKCVKKGPVWSSVTVHTRERIEGHADEDVSQINSL